MVFLRQSWYAAAFSDEVGREPMTVVMLDQEVLLYRTAAGEVVALGNRCPHRFVEMHTGTVIDDAIQCPYHGLRFGPKGNCVFNPHDGGVTPSAAKVPAYPAQERYGVVWLWMGDAADADPDLIPDFSMFVPRPGLRVLKGRTEIKADYRLVVDNLLDLSHVEFLHPHFRGSGTASRVKHTVTYDARTVHSTYVSDEKPEGLLGVLWVAHGGKPGGDAIHTRDIAWSAPCNLLLDIWTAQPGQTREESVQSSSAHFLTPQGRGVTQYLWYFLRNAKVDDQKLDEMIEAGTRMAFEQQDRPAIESQQRYIGDRDLMDLKPVLLKSDAATVRARRQLAALIRAEQGGEPVAVSTAMETEDA